MKPGEQGKGTLRYADAVCPRKSGRGILEAGPEHRQEVHQKLLAAVLANSLCGGTNPLLVGDQ